MNYHKITAYLNSLASREWRLDLTPMRDICNSFNNPQNSYPAIHIAGTNGKGSTAAFLTSILMHSGYRVGLFTSPHLVDVRERIQINRKLISETHLADVISRIRDSFSGEERLTYFELLTLAAFIYFKEQKVDIAVIETGLGGRFDATNVVTPKVAVITNISLDHQSHLGSTLVEIAGEKCGIIKRGIPTVSALQSPEVMDTIRHFCDDSGSPLCLAGEREMSHKLGLAGRHQMQNASCAVEAAELLADAGFKIQNVQKGLKDVRWEGRLECVMRSPKILLDGAHNPDGAKALAEYIKEQFKRDDAVLMLGVLSDKDIAGICRALAPVVREVICVKTPSERSASPKDVAAKARSFGATVHQEEDVPQALKKWIKKLGKNDTLIISGSLSTVGAAKGYLRK